MERDENDHIHDLSKQHNEDYSIHASIDIKQEALEVKTTKDYGIGDDSDLDLAEEFIYTILQQVENLCEIVTNGDHCVQRRQEVNQNLNDAVSCYKDKLLYKHVKTEDQDEINPLIYDFTQNNFKFDIDSQDVEFDQESKNEALDENSEHVNSTLTPTKQNELEKKNLCDICGKGFAKKENLKDHENLHSGQKPYKCKYCSSCFASKGNHRTHEKSHEGLRRIKKLKNEKGKLETNNECENLNCMKTYGINKSKLWCKKCISYNRLLQNIENKKSESKESKISSFYYLKYDKETDIFQCAVCSKTGTSRMNILEHIKNIHIKDEAISKDHLSLLNEDQKENCGSKTCKRFYGTTYLFLWCKNCTSGQKFLPRSEKDYDIATFQYLRYNKESGLYYCSVCDKSANLKYHILRHAKNLHQKGQNSSMIHPNSEQKDDCESRTCKKLYGPGHLILWCKQCTLIQKIPKPSKKRIRIRIKKEKPYQLCPECGKNVQFLEQHLKTVHDNEKQICQQCNLELKNIRTLTDHIKNVHEKIPCTECGRQVGVGKMSCHMKMHQKRFKCDVCGKGFGSKESLKDHRNIHTGEKPYKCKYCSSCFASHGNHRMHERSHEGTGRNYSKK